MSAEDSKPDARPPRATQWLETMYDKQRKRFVRMFRGKLNSLQDSEDAVQDGVVELLARDDSRPVENPQNFLSRTIHNKVRDQLRARDVRERHHEKLLGQAQLRGDHPAAEAIHIANELQEALDRAIDELPPSLWAALNLVKLHGLTHKQAARELGVHPPYKVQRLVAKAMRRCQDTIESVRENGNDCKQDG